MKKFQEIQEQRAAAKAAYLSQSFDKSALEKLAKKGNLYIQYTEPRSRGKVGSGDVKSITDKGVIIDTRFGDKDYLVTFDKITMADNLKK
jgi:hypothetical protein